MATSAEVDFLIQDAALGVTLAQLAMQAARDSFTRMRNLANAEAALVAVRHRSSQVTLSAEDGNALDSVLGHLATLVRSLRG
jgi:hypothetical protein